MESDSLMIGSPPLPSLALETQVSALIRAKRLRHVAVIMDGNRRWAQQKRLPSLFGHRQGVESLKSLVRYAGEIGLEVLTAYAFSTENWQRGAEEVGYLMALFVEALAAELEQLARNRVRIRFIGDVGAFPADLRRLIETAQAKTAENPGLCLQVAANYGGRQELLQAIRSLGDDIRAGVLTPDAITEETIQARLYTGNLPDPDLLIRTGGESRISNYLLWQCAYTEFYVTDTLWPDFDTAAFNAALNDFARRQRRYGQ
jgi:undecaprenyl diphosphate synthase